MTSWQNTESSKKAPPNFSQEIPGDKEFKTAIQENLLEKEIFLTAQRNRSMNNDVRVQEIYIYYIF